MDDLRNVLRNIALGRVFGPAMALIAVSYLAVGAFALVAAWQAGPQVFLDAKRLEPFSAHKEARIVESWVAMRFEPSEMGSSDYWRGFARVTPCAVVEYEGEWGTARRAFCGTRSNFHNGYTLHDLRELSGGVPFQFSRDENGFAVPEIRVGKAGLDWLAKGPPLWKIREERIEKRLGHFTALDELRMKIERPVDLAVESWSRPPRAVPLAFDPAHPQDALPAGYVEARRNAEPIWYPLFVAGIVGVVFWLAGMNIVLSALVPVGRVLLGALPLLALPWWSEELPRFLRHLNIEVAETVADEFLSIGAAARIVASEPEDAQQYRGERITFGVRDGLYADTLGRFTYRATSLPTADEALASLVSQTADQARRWGAAERVDLFARLQRDKEAGFLGAGMAFLPAAKEAMSDAKADEDVQLAARRFLSEWVVITTAQPEPNEPAFRERVRLFRELTDTPVTVIAYPASLIVERAEQKAKDASAGSSRRRR